MQQQRFVQVAGGFVSDQLVQTGAQNAIDRKERGAVGIRIAAQHDFAVVGGEDIVVEQPSDRLADRLNFAQ